MKHVAVLADPPPQMLHVSFLDTHVSLAPTHVCLSVRPKVRPSFPFYQRVWLLYVKSWRERTPIIFQFWVWVRFPEIGRGGGAGCFWPKKTFLTRKLFRPKKLFWLEKTFLTQKLFWPQNFFDPQKYLTWKTFLIQKKLFLTRKTFLIKRLPSPKFCQTERTRLAHLPSFCELVCLRMFKCFACSFKALWLNEQFQMCRKLRAGWLHCFTGWAALE